MAVTTDIDGDRHAFFSSGKLGGLARFYAAVIRALCVLLDFVITVYRGYFFAFIVYLQEGNNILYMGIVLFIISIILYFINIIRKND